MDCGGHTPAPARARAPAPVIVIVIVIVVVVVIATACSLQRIGVQLQRVVALIPGDVKPYYPSSCSCTALTGIAKHAPRQCHHFSPVLRWIAAQRTQNRPALHRGLNGRRTTLKAVDDGQYSFFGRQATVAVQGGAESQLD